MILTCIFGALFAALLISAAMFDLKTLEIPDHIPAAICLLALIEICCRHLSITNALAGIALGGLPVLLVALLTKEGIGGGDVKLMAAMGFFLGTEGALIAPLLGSVLFLLVLAFRRKKDHLSGAAFAPALAAGGTITYIIMQIGGNVH